MRLRTAVLVGLLLVIGAAAPVLADDATHLDGPSPAIWLSDPEGVDGDNGIEQGDWIEGARGSAIVTDDKAKIRVRATGLEPGHVYTMWVVYFNDHTLCVDGCNGPDLAVAGGGSIYGDGLIANNNGTGVFVANLADGDGAGYVGSPPPPPFAMAAFDAGPNNEFHVVIRSHGPQIPGLVQSQLNTFGGGCEVSVGPLPEQVGDFPVPQNPGECGEIQLYVFG